MEKMGYEEIRSRMKREVIKHGEGTGPRGRYSQNRLNALAVRAQKKFGDKAAIELGKEFTSKRR